MAMKHTVGDFWVQNRGRVAAMKIGFALSLSTSGIRLIHRAADGWRRVGDANFDSDTLAVELTELRRSAARLSPEQSYCKLLLPNDQIRYISLDTTQVDVAQIEAVVAEATPYALSEVAYDFAKGGGRTYIAIVARETLREAENFARDHGFQPIYFASAPEDFTYWGEPFLGATDLAAEVIEVVDDTLRDDAPVKIIGDAVVPKAPAKKAPATDDKETVPVKQEMRSEAAAPHAGNPSDGPKSEVPKAIDAITLPEQENLVFSSRASGRASEPNTVRAVAPPAAASVPSETLTSQPATAAHPPSISIETPTEGKAGALAMPPAEPKITPVEPERNAPKPPTTLGEKKKVINGIKAKGQLLSKVRSQLSKAAPDSKPTPPKSQKPPAFSRSKPAIPAVEKTQDTGFGARLGALFGSSKRSTARSEPSLSTGLGNEPAGVQKASSDTLEPIVKTPITALDRAFQKEAATTQSQPQSLPTEPAPKTQISPTKIPPAAKPSPPQKRRIGLAAGLPLEDSETTKPRLAPEKKPAITATPISAEQPLKAEKPKFGVLGGFTLPGSKSETASAKKSAPIVVIDEAEQERLREIEAEKLTVFGARKSRRNSARRSGFLALILTLLLLLFLAAVAIFAGRDEQAFARLFGLSPTTTASTDNGTGTGLPTPSTADETTADILDAEDQSASPVLPMVTETVTQTTPAEPETVAGTAPESVAEQNVFPSLSPAEAQRIYAATGVWQRAPRIPFVPRLENTDDVFIAAIDPPSPSLDAVALATVGTAPDFALVSLRNPPPANTRFSRDARGFFEATPEGVELPSGITLFAGNPGVSVPTRPKIFAPTDAQTDTALAQTETAVSDSQIAAAEFTGIRPKIRPQNFSDQVERDTLGGFTVSELQGFRPRLRPNSLSIPEPDTEAIDEALNTAQRDEAIELAAAEAANENAQKPSDLAVAQSTRPDGRPRNFERKVAAAAAAENAPARPTASAAVVRPSGNIPGGVAAAATEKNQIRLNQTALLGTSGKANSKRAVVRLSNGRVATVAVGDRLDGGRVSAIGDGFLTYVKNGRTVTLRMPNG